MSIIVPALGRHRRWRSFLALFGLVLAVLAACAGVDAPLATDLEAQASDVHSCARWFADLDDAIDRSDVRDVGAYRIPGYPYLRVDRFTASFSPVADSSDATFAAWLARLEALDRTARLDEIANLPDTAATLGIAAPADVARLTARCAVTLRQRDLASPGARAQLAARARVPDDYHDWERLVGLYPLVSIPFARSIDAWEIQAKSQFQRAGGDPGAVPIVRYAPQGEPADAAKLTKIVTGARRDALGIPTPIAADRTTLLQAYAPVFAVATGGSYDRIGPLVWRGGEAPSVDTGRPAVYQDLAFTRFDDEVLIQLVYTVWFPERPTSGPFDTLGGDLDGVVLRVTLDDQGRPLVYDTIHSCGCFHMFFPTDRLVTRPAPEDQREWAFVPAVAPAATPPQRIVVTTESATHYVVHVGLDDGGATTRYTLIDYDSLRSLPTPRAVAVRSVRTVWFPEASGASGAYSGRWGSRAPGRCGSGAIMRRHSSAGATSTTPT